MPLGVLGASRRLSGTSRRLLGVFRRILGFGVSRRVLGT